MGVVCFHPQAKGIVLESDSPPQELLPSQCLAVSVLSSGTSKSFARYLVHM
jgi:hypothetical protein